MVNVENAVRGKRAGGITLVAIGLILAFLLLLLDMFLADDLDAAESSQDADQGSGGRRHEGEQYTVRGFQRFLFRLRFGGHFAERNEGYHTLFFPVKGLMVWPFCRYVIYRPRKRPIRR